MFYNRVAPLGSRVAVIQGVIAEANTFTSLTTSPADNAHGAEWRIGSTWTRAASISPLPTGVVGEAFELFIARPELCTVINIVGGSSGAHRTIGGRLIRDLSRFRSLTTFIVNRNAWAQPMPVNLPATLTSLQIASSGVTGPVPPFSENLGTVSFNTCAGLTVADVDAVLANLVTAGKTTGTRICNLGGTGTPVPSAAGLASKAILEARGWTVTVNT